MGKGGVKGGTPQIFVCDYCNQFEGSFGEVAKHEKPCKVMFDKLCKRAGTFDTEPAEGAGPTAKEKKKETKKRQLEALGLDTADRLDDVETKHLQKVSRAVEVGTATEAAADAAAATVPPHKVGASSDAPSFFDNRDAPSLSKAAKRKAAKRARKGASSTEVTSGAAAAGAAREEDARAKAARVAMLLLGRR